MYAFAEGLIKPANAILMQIEIICTLLQIGIAVIYKTCAGRNKIWDI